MPVLRKRMAAAGVSFLSLLAMTVLASYFLRTSPPEMRGSTTASRLPELRKLVEDQEKESAEAVASYSPKSSVTWTT